MPLQEIGSADDLTAFRSSHPGGALVCFSATWCGPCKASKPQLEALADEYASQGTVHVGIVYEHTLGDAIHANNIRAFPTYALYVDGAEKGRVEGVNFDGIRKMIAEAGCKKDFGVGHSLGGGDSAAAALSPEAAREARLARLGAAAAPAPAPAVADEKPNANAKEGSSASSEDVEMKDAAEEKPPADATNATDESMEIVDGAEDGKAGNADGATCTEVPEMVDPTADLSKELLDQLTSGMGFSLLRSQKGLLNGGGTVEGAVDWLMQHQDDADIDDPIALVPKGGAGVAQSYKCNECGKILSNMANLELHANKTGHSDFEESTVAVKPLTAEEKAKKVEEIKALLKAKRAEREEEEKKHNVASEKQRRFMGQEMQKTREDMEREARKRDALQRKREKEAARRERERLRAELAKDKLERQANKGKLKTALGADGYNPSAIQYDVGADGGGAGVGAGAAAGGKKTFKADPKKIDEYIKKVSSYRAGGDGQKCLKILLTYVGNVVDNPEEEKFQTINMENKAFKGKVKPFLGAKALLVAVGFKQNEAGTALVLKEDADRDTLKETKNKLESAYSSY